MHQKNKLTSHRSLEADRVHKTVSSLSQIYICFFSLSAAEYRQFENSKFTTMAKHRLCPKCSKKPGL